MIDRHRIRDFRLDRNAHSGDLCVLIAGPRLYKRALVHAFPQLSFGTSFEDRYGQLDWGVYAKRATQTDEASLQELLQILATAYLLEDDLTECYALDLHTRTDSGGGYERTEIGDLVYRSKSYNTPSIHVPVPSCRFRLPTRARPSTCRDSSPRASPKGGLPMLTGALSKVRQTRPMKDCITVSEKRENLSGAFVARGDFVADKSLILVDDIYHSGATMNEAGRTLLAAGAKTVLGLVAPKTARDLPDDARARHPRPCGPAPCTGAGPRRAHARALAHGRCA